MNWNHAGITTEDTNVCKQCNTGTSDNVVTVDEVLPEGREQMSYPIFASSQLSYHITVQRQLK